MLLHNGNLSHNIQDQGTRSVSSALRGFSPIGHNLTITEGSRGVKEGHLSHFITSALSEVLSEKVTVTDRPTFGSESMPLSAAYR